MKVLKMKEVYLDYMDILLEIHLLKRKWFLYVENDIPFCQHLQWKDLLPLIYLKGRVIKKFVDFVLSQVVSNTYELFISFLFAMKVSTVIDKIWFYLGTNNECIPG